jgi:PPP family 3-phenylpropionic acid transporter
LPPRDYFSPRLAAFYATLGIATGVGMPFFPVWLDYKGLDPQQIGVLLATPMVVRILCVPVATRLADRYNVLRGAIILASLGSIIGHLVLVAVSGFVAMVAAMALAAAFFTPTFPLTDAYALRGLAERRKAYGPVRLWSSAAYIAANVGSGMIVGAMPRAGIVWLIIAAYTLGVLLAWLMIPLPPHREAEAHHAGAGKSLWRMPAFVLIVAAYGCVQASHAVYYGFSTLDWSSKGIGDTTIGVLWAIGVIVEIGLFAISGFVTRFVSPPALLVIGGIGGLVRWSLMALDPPLVALPCLQALHALTFCATHVGAMAFISHAVPPGRAATAQGDLSAVMSAIFAVAMGFSGFLFNRYGDFAYMAMALLSAAGAAIAFGACLIWRDPHENAGQPHSAGSGG